LRAEVLDVWEPEGSYPRSIVLVSHDIQEVAFMADRIVVLDARPGRVRTVVENRLPRPRDYRSPELLRLVDELHNVITGMEMPDAAGPPAPAGAYEPLPHAAAAEIAGLLEYLDARGGREDVFRIASDTAREFGKVITATNAAEMLGFVETPHRTVVLAPDGLRFVRASPADRKVIFRERIGRLRLFADVGEALRQAPAAGLDREFVLELVALHLPAESLEATLATFLDWARFADLFAYDEASGRLRPQ
jgi:NitT/TauT family transport system ATP-binding protein